MKKIKNTLTLILTIFLFSCYQATESSSGSVAVKINSDIMRDAPEGFNGVLKLAVFDEGDIDSLVEIISGDYPEITYLGDFPTPLLANNSVPVNGYSGVLSLLNVPSDRPLTLLVERYGDRWYDDLYDEYFHSYSGVSETFEVEGGGTAEVAVTLFGTAYAAGMSVNKYSTYASSHFRLYDPSDLDSIINFSGNNIESIDYGTTELTFNTYGTSGSISGGTAFVTFEPADAILPGRKTRVLVSENQNISQDQYIGLSEEFELRPGLSDYVSVTYYQYTSSSSWNC